MSSETSPSSMPQPMPTPRKLLGCALGLSVLLAGFAAGATPPERVSVSQWAEQERYVAAESGSPFPGKWKNDRAPYLVEMMDCMGFDHPARTVTVKGSAQTAKSEGGVNAVGASIDREPSPFLIVLPSIEEGSKYNKTKFQPTVDATPALKRKMRDTNSRDENSSTATFKKFSGGFGVITGANSSKGLQMISARLRVYEEIAEYPADVDGRGDPIEQGETRGLAWDKKGPKSIFISAPGTRVEKNGQKIGCRISDLYDLSDRRRLYVPCPHCDTFQILTHKALKIERAAKPYGAYFVCASGSGCVIEEKHQEAMVRGGWWIKTYDGGTANPPPPVALTREEAIAWRQRDGGPRGLAAGRDPGFAIWQAYSLFVSWDTWIDRIVKAKGKPALAKALWQQIYGEAYEENGEAPDHERLFERREKYPAGRLLPGILFTTGAVDVQGGRLEWAIWGFDRDMGQTLIDFGIIEGDPEQADVWRKLDPVIDRRLTDAWGRQWPVDWWGVDTGYATQSVYRYVRSHAMSGRVFALDGRANWRLPPLGAPSVKDVDHNGRKVGKVALWPVGTWDLKSELYSALRLTLEGPDDDGVWPKGAVRFNERCDKNWLQQLTAEHIDIDKGGARSWKKHHERNEQHDLAVYARAGARHMTDPLTESDWDDLVARRVAGGQTQTDLSAYWTPGLAARAGEAAPQAPAPMPEPAPANAVREAAAEPQTPAWLPPADDFWKGRA